jgi:hypothetical protein
LKRRIDSVKRRIAALRDASELGDHADDAVESLTNAADRLSELV